MINVVPHVFMHCLLVGLLVLSLFLPLKRFYCHPRTNVPKEGIMLHFDSLRSVLKPNLSVKSFRHCFKVNFNEYKLFRKSRNQNVHDIRKLVQ